MIDWKRPAGQPISPPGIGRRGICPRSGSRRICRYVTHRSSNGCQAKRRHTSIRHVSIQFRRTREKRSH